MVRVMTLNVELSRHLHRFVPFARHAQPDVLCLQEVVESDMPTIVEGTGLSHVHLAAMARHHGTPGEAPFGVALLSRAEMSERLTEPYAGAGDGHTLLDRQSPETRVATRRYVLASARIAFENVTLDVATTHFPWTDHGQPRDFQFHAMDDLIGRFTGRRLLLTGDFNGPRGGPVFNRLAAVLADNVPDSARTTLDPKLHRAGPLDLVVYGFFT